MAALHIDDSEFEHRILKANGTFLVDFWAEWCGPCRQISPILDEIANERAGRITIAKVNIDKNPGTPQKFGVRGIPTLIIFKDGQALSTKVGSLPKSKLVEWIDSVIGTAA